MPPSTRRVSRSTVDLIMKVKTLRKKIRRLEARLREGPKKLSKLKRKLEAMAAAEARKAKRKAAARAGEAPQAAQKGKRKHNLSPEGRAKLSAAMKARWAAKRAAAEANPQDTSTNHDVTPEPAPQGP